MTVLFRRVGALASTALLVASVLSVVAVGHASAAVIVAADLTPTGSVNLTSFTNDPTAPFTDPGDGFQTFQRGVSATIPFAVADDSAVGFPTDSQGIITEADTDVFFGVVDTVNGATNGPVTATWVFDISGATDLSLTVDVGAMGDFESSDAYDFAASIDGGVVQPLLSFDADEAATRDYTLAGGSTFSLNDPLNAGPIELNNVLQTLSAPITGTGNALTVTFTANTDGGSEAVAFRNLIIMGGDGGGDPTDPVPGDLVINEVMQNPSAVSDGAGEWFEIANISSQDIDLDGWTIADNGSDSHTISGPLVVPAGGFVVLANNADSGTNGGVAVDYSYGGGFFLANGDDELLLSDPDATEFDRIEWDGGPVWPDPSGASMNLDPGSQTATDNDDGSNWCNATSAFGDGDLGTPGAANTICEIEPPVLRTFIHVVQGPGTATPLAGQTVEIQGIVTTLFEDNDVVEGFFVQEEDLDADGDPNTSEGIFVFCNLNCVPAVAVNDQVTVQGIAEEFFGMTQIDAEFGSIVIDTSGNPLPTPAAVDLPAGGSTQDEATFESIEGMLVVFTDTLTVTEYFQLGRYGQVVLTEGSRSFQYTHTNEPDVAGFAAFTAELATRQIILDDDNNDQNEQIAGPDAPEPYPFPPGGLSTTNRFRGGDTIANLFGVLHWSFAGQQGTDAWRVRPVPGIDNVITPVNTRPSTPDDVGGTLTVANFNVLNYFTTIDVTSSSTTGDCGPSGTLDCRGADSTAELVRQTDKIVAALAEIDADIVGLVEIENNASASLQGLVDAVNAVVGAGTYDFVDAGTIGTDAIKVGLIYRPATVAPAGAPAILDSSVDPTFIDSKNRPVLIQTFDEVATGERFTVAVNHLKSKGSACDDVGDPDANDGQGNCAGTREAGAIALANYLATDPTGSGDPDMLIIGDLNAYKMEDAITALTSAGYTDLIEQFLGNGAYSFVFNGQLGYLDHALGNASMTEQVTGVAEWHINADEVNLFDYNDDIRDTGEASFEQKSGALPIYEANAFRSSDHDPVIVGLALDSAPPVPTCFGVPATIVGSEGRDVIRGTNGNDVIVTLGGNDLVFGRGGDDLICTGEGSDRAFGSNGDDMIDLGPGRDLGLGQNGDDTILGGDDRDTLIGGNGDDELFGGAATDIILAGRGDDLLDGGVGDNDYGNGQLGFDTCVDIERAVRCEA